MTHLPYVLLMVATGIGIPIMAALNAGLGGALGSPIAAVVVLCFVALCASLALLAILPRPDLSQALSQPPSRYFAGLLFVLYIGGITLAAPKIGIGNAVLFVILGQLFSAAVIDHFGLFGSLVAPLEKARALGLAFVVLGVILAQKNVTPPL